MNERELIKASRSHLYNATVELDANNQAGYTEHMNTVLDLLIKKLLGTPPGAFGGPDAKFNPERVLEQVAMAIKHRTVSSTGRWYIVYYYTRLTCVPTPVEIPTKIILHEFTEKMVQEGFSTIYWNQLKTNVIKLYKELES